MEFESGQNKNRSSKEFENAKELENSAASDLVSILNKNKALTSMCALFFIGLLVSVIISVVGMVEIYKHKKNKHKYEYYVNMAIIGLILFMICWIGSVFSITKIDCIFYKTKLS